LKKKSKAPPVDDNIDFFELSDWKRILTHNLFFNPITNRDLTMIFHYYLTTLIL
jgi:hypothetical protein